MKERKRKLYVIPGLGESTRMSNYREVIHFARKNNITVIPVSVNWDEKMDMTDYVRQVDEKIPDGISDDYILGFSFGAYIASVLSVKKMAKGYVFCSISPYFKDTIKNIPQETKDYFGKKFMDSLKKYSFPENSTGKAWFLVGKKDWQLAIDTAKNSYDKWKGKKKFYSIQNAGHQLNHQNYLKKIEEILKTL